MSESITIPIGVTLDEVERRVIVATLEAVKQNRKAAAEALGISRSAFYMKAKRHGIAMAPRSREGLEAARLRARVAELEGNPAAPPAPPPGPAPVYVPPVAVPPSSGPPRGKPWL